MTERESAEIEAKPSSYVNGPDPYSNGWECDEQGEWRPCFAPGCTHNRRLEAEHD